MIGEDNTKLPSVEACSGAIVDKGQYNVSSLLAPLNEAPFLVFESSPILGVVLVRLHEQQSTVKRCMNYGSTMNNRFSNLSSRLEKCRSQSHELI